MPNVKSLTTASKLFVKQHSTVILTGIGVSGTISTAILAARAGREATLHLAANDQLDLPIKEKTIEVWRYYIPPVVVGGVTIASIVSANTISTKRIAAVTAAYSLSEKSLGEYRDKVIEKIGDKRERGVKDLVAQERVEKNPPPESIAISEDKSLTLEMFTGRYFECDMETLRRAQNDVNEKLLKEDEVTLSEFYWKIGLESTSYSDYVGWKSDKLMELDFSTAIATGGKPCITFDYNYTVTL